MLKEHPNRFVSPDISSKSPSVCQHLDLAGQQICLDFLNLLQDFRRRSGTNRYPGCAGPIASPNGLYSGCHVPATI